MTKLFLGMMASFLHISDMCCLCHAMETEFRNSNLQAGQDFPQQGLNMHLRAQPP